MERLGLLDPSVHANALHRKSWLKGSSQNTSTVVKTVLLQIRLNSAAANICIWMRHAVNGFRMDVSLCLLQTDGNIDKKKKKGGLFTVSESSRKFSC